MTGRAEQETRRQRAWDALMPTAVLTLCFTASGALGCLAAGAAEDGAASLFSSYLQSYLTVFAGDASVAPSVWAVLWELCRWPALVLALGSTALGAVAIPAVFCARGFLLAYAIAAFARTFGAPGLLGALAVFGVGALLASPVLFGVGGAAFSAALGLALGRPEEGRGRLLRLFPCGGLLALAVVIQWRLTPQLVGLVSAWLVTV